MVTHRKNAAEEENLESCSPKASRLQRFRGECYIAYFDSSPTPKKVPCREVTNHARNWY